MSLRTSRAERRSRRRRSSRRVWLVCGGLVVLAVLGSVWIGVHAYLAKDALLTAASTAETLQKNVRAGDFERVTHNVATFTTASADARSLTSDPVWKLAETVPGIGGNLRAVREVAGVVDSIAREVLPPLVSVAERFTIADVVPEGGAVNLTIFDGLASPMLDAESAMTAAAQDARRIEPNGTVNAVHDAVRSVQRAATGAAEAISAARRTVQLLPEMLGGRGDRSYVVMFQNNAEARATGGSPSALALVSASNGKVSLGRQASSADFNPPFASPVIALDDDVLDIYSARVGMYLQDVNFTPDFPTSARVVSEMWKRKFGGEVDGVISLDTVSLSFLLKATGPLVSPDGVRLDANSVVNTLLRDVYARSDREAQDGIFAGVASTVFTAISSGSVDPDKLVSALSRAGAERRILVWSADAAQQGILAETSLAGILPDANSPRTVLGVYLNDATGAKMDLYLDQRIVQSSASCREDGVRSYRVAVTLTSTAPIDAATSLPPFVTGDGFFGIAPGNISTRLVVYGPAGGALLGTTLDGTSSSVSSSKDGNRPVAQKTIDITPGQSATFVVDFSGDGKRAGEVQVVATPGIGEPLVDTAQLGCESALQWFQPAG